MKKVMVVDDSITVRKVTARLLKRQGMEVFTAKDGIDATSQLRENIPDLMLLDVEMPRMDGFELATQMRNDDDLKHIPIIMITSRTGKKHRTHASKIGINIHLGKPFNEQELLESIGKLLMINH
jgi:chemosensory pili system protein ChpA (sensor histidine kinase/response regulator)